MDNVFFPETSSGDGYRSRLNRLRGIQTLKRPILEGVCVAILARSTAAYASEPEHSGDGSAQELATMILVPIVLDDFRAASRESGHSISSPGNLKAAKRESGEIAKGIRASTGISVTDFGKCGLSGCSSESVLNKGGIRW
jgi:hypothetical protein